MTNKDKKKFIASLCNSVRDVAIDRIQYMPDEWDGLELREYLARLFNQECRGLWDSQLSKRRLREFKSAVATKFGL